MMDRVRQLVKDESGVVFSDAVVEDAINAAITATWLLNGIVDSKQEVSGVFAWPFIPTKASVPVRPVWAPTTPCVLHEAWGQSEVWPSGSATIHGISFPPSYPVSLQPPLDEAVAYLAASFLLQDSYPETALGYGETAEELRASYIMKKRRVFALGGPSDIKKL